MSSTAEDNFVTDIVDLTEIDSLCRICLTKSTSMILMSSPLSKEVSKNPSILEALEKVMSVKLLKNKKYPSSVCAMCKGLLKISYDLNKIFNRSQTLLTEYFEDILFEKDSTITTNKNNEKNVAPVELIFRNKKYNLDDVIIVEDEKEEQQNFQGFLSNLGTSVSAVFVKKSEVFNKEQKTAQNLNNYVITLESNAISENKDEAIVEISLEDLQGCNVNDLFPDHQILDFLHENQENEISLGHERPTEEENVDKENLVLRKIYKCDACDVLCANRTRLKLHLKKYHIHQVPYLCDMCSAVSFHQNGVQDTPHSDIISCEECGSVNTKRKIMGKMRVDTIRKVVREYLCQICGHISKTATSARYHKKKHYEVQYHCNMCNKKYHSKATLEWHVNSHNNVKNLLCSVCGKKFNYYTALVYHMRIHTNERKYMCEICDKRFYMRNSLKRHIRRHTGERPYVCKYCGKGSFSPEERRKHEMIHTGQRPFKCQYCDKGFTSTFNRKIHHMSHPGPHGCDYCSKTFMKVEFLTLHLKTRHKELTVNPE